MYTVKTEVLVILVLLTLFVKIISRNLNINFYFYCIATFCVFCNCQYNKIKILNLVLCLRSVKSTMEQKKATLSSLKVQDMVQIALMAAMTYIATAVINIPSGVIVKGVVHLGDTMIFLAAILLGKEKAFLAAAVGMCMFDLLSPYAIWAPFTFFIKGFMAYIASTVAYRKHYKGDNVWNNIFAFILGGIWMIAAYYVAGALIMHFVMKVAFGQAFILSLAEIPGNITQVIAGIVLALPIVKILKKAKVSK